MRYIAVFVFVLNYVYYRYYCKYFLWFCCRMVGVGSRVVYELDYKKPILYIVPIESILGKLPVAPVGDTGTISHAQRLSGRSRRPQAGRRQWPGCRMWFVNSWALGWSSDM
jgi:hypothetical protein